MAPNFLSVTCCGEAFPGLGVQGVVGLNLLGALFLLDGGRRREEKKKEKTKNCHGNEGFPGAGPTFLAVQKVTAVRYN
jgi:hypothetical protein